MTYALTLLSAEVPLIDLDGTVFVQFAIFVVLLAVLHTFLFAPYLRVREQRDKGIGGARAEARAMEERATAIVADYETRLTKAKQRGADERLKLRAEGQAHERKVLGEARETAQQGIAEARARVLAAEQAARKALAAEAPAVARAVAARILGRQV